MHSSNEKTGAQKGLRVSSGRESLQEGTSILLEKTAFPVLPGKSFQETPGLRASSNQTFIKASPSLFHSLF